MGRRSHWRRPRRSLRWRSNAIHTMDELYQKAKEDAERDRIFRRLLRDGAMGFGDPPELRLSGLHPYVSLRCPDGRPGIEVGLKWTF